jgi:hypothetical protein
MQPPTVIALPTHQGDAVEALGVRPDAGKKASPTAAVEVLLVVCQG